MSQPLPHGGISVAMCTYNGERHLEEQLATIAVQTRLPAELVVCDDCSTDCTLEILESFAAKAPFPVYVHRNGTQLRSTRNFDQATRLCRGETIALCDQDDRWLPSKLALLGTILDENADIGVVFSDATLIDDNSRPAGGTLWKSLRFNVAVQQRFRQDPAAILLERPVTTGATMLFRSELLKQYPAIPPSWVHDGWITWMGIFWSSVVFLTEPVTEYRIHSAQQLGVGKTSLLSRLQTTRAKQRKVYANAAVEFRDLLAYVHTDPALEERWAVTLTNGIDFFAQRAKAPMSPWLRPVFLLRHREQYRRFYGSALRACIRDLWMS